MDNVLIVALLFWPGVVVLCAGLNMLISWTFSWQELILDLLMGMIAGYFLFAGAQPNPGGVITFFFIFSHGVPAIIWTLTGGFVDSPQTFFWVMAGIRLGATVWTAAWDHASVAIGGRFDWAPFFFSFVVAPAKMAFSLATSAIGLLIWLAGLGNAIFGNGKAGFAGGVLFTEFSPGSGSLYATTVGWTVHTWRGNFPIKHELYHTRQCIYLGDWMIPMWCVGIIWGLISAAIDGHDINSDIAFAADGEVGNPVEIAAYKLG